MRVPTKGSWTVEVPDGMKQVDNGDSWQAFDDQIVVYVSSMSIPGRHGGTAPRAEIAAVLAKNAPASAQVERLSYDTGLVIGLAEVSPADGAWRLNGNAVVDGTLATCVIDFADSTHRDRVEAIWRSLYCPSEDLFQLVYAALDRAVHSVAEGGPLAPFFIVEGSHGRKLRRFASDTLEEGQAAMREAVAKLGRGVSAYAMAYDGYMTFEGKKWDAILSEAAERGAPAGVFFAQRYQPKKGAFGRFKRVGNAALVLDREAQQLPNNGIQTDAPAARR